MDSYDIENTAQATEALANASVKLGQDLDSLQVSFSEITREGNAFSTSFSTAIRTAMKDVIIEGENLSDALRSLALSMADKALDKALDPIVGAAGNALGGVVTSLLGFAHGGVIDAGNKRPFATGGIVTGPTNFPMAHGTGLMGEAGPEAILPLARGADGRLGIASSGNSPNISVNFNIQTPDANSFAASQSQIAKRLRHVIANASRGGANG